MAMAIPSLRKPAAIRQIGQSQRHERLQGALLATDLFLLVTSTVIGKAVRDALFLSYFTALQMTYADLQTLFAIGLAMSVYFRVQRSLTLPGVLIASAIFFAIGDAACWWAATLHRAWLIRAIYYWVGIQTAITLPQVSTLAVQVLTTRQAKRSFGVIGSGAIFGWIAGGLVTQAAAGRVGTEALLLGMAAMTATSAALVLAIRRTIDAAARDTRHDDPSSPGRGFLRGASLVWRSPHLRTVATLVFLSSIVTTIAGLQFKAIASQSIGATDRLASFLGSFNFHAGLVALAIQVLFTSRVLQHFGVGVGLVIAPLALTMGSAGVFVWGTLSTVVFLKGSEQVLRHSIDRAALDMLYVPLSPDETLQGKTFIDSVVYRIGDAAGALGVAFGAGVLHFSFSSMSLLSLAFLAAWIGGVIQARHRYVERLLVTLRPPRPLLAASGGGRDLCLRLVDRIFQPNQVTRLQALRTLNAAQACDRSELGISEPLATALAAEIVGLYRLIQTSASPSSHIAATPEYRDSIERILRLLNVVSPDTDSLSVLAALQSGNPRLKAIGLEYLENVLRLEYRRFLVPLLDLEA
jgi:ATP:ADP antiporter, AAA family